MLHAIFTFVKYSLSLSPDSTLYKLHELNRVSQIGGEN